MNTTAASLEPATSGTQLLHKRPRFVMSRLVPCVAVILLGGPSAHAAVTPLAHYTFNDNATPAGVTAVGTPTYSNGQLVLNGNSCLSLASPISATDNFGMEVICTPTFNDSYNYPLALNNGANNGWGILQLFGEYQGIAEDGGGFFGSAGADSAVLNVPVRLALVRSGGVTTIYRNGSPVGTTTTVSRNTLTKLTIGGNQLTTAPVFEGFFKGSIDEVRVFTFAPGEFNPATDLTTHPKVELRYTFNDNATPAGVTAVGTPTYSNGQLVLDGNSCLSMASPLSVTDNFGMEIICTPTFNDSSNYSLSLNDGSSNGCGLLQLSELYGGVSQSGGSIFGSAGSALLNVPVRLALVRNGGVTTIYKNGVVAGTTTTISQLPLTRFTIGGNQTDTTPTYSGWFKGRIDEVRVFTFAPGAFNPATDLSDFTPNPIAGLPGVKDSSVAWGDYDSDGRLDFLLTGESAGGQVSQVWRNTGSGFTNVTASVAPGLPGGCDSSVAWGDYDNDGRLDFLLTGRDASFNRFSQLWRNTGSGFTNVTASVAPGLPGVAYSSVAWGDYDNDGRLDFLLTGSGSGGAVSQLWRNTGNGFTNVTDSAFPPGGLPGVYYSSVAWGDYDNDGLLDFLLTGISSFGGMDEFSQLWRNTGSGFTNVTDSVAPGLPGVALSSVAWGDYDNDGHLDFLLTGDLGSTRVSQLWRNTGSGFTNVTDSVAPNLPRVNDSSVAWGDYDNDGRLDFLLTGSGSGGAVSQLWRNTGSGFTNVTAMVAPGLSQVSGGSVAWGDYENDGRLDFIVTGSPGSTGVSQVWRNNTPATNAPPAAPSGLSVTSAGAELTFSWAAASDAQTSPDGLAYHLRIGTTPGGSELLSPMAAPSGTPRLPRSSALQPSRSRKIKAPLPIGQPIYWSVQASDNGFTASPFATEKVFSLAGFFVPTSGVVLPGDTNGDGVVSQAEFNAVRAALGTNELATQNTAGYYTEAQVQSLNVGTPLISQVSPGRFRLTLGVQRSANLSNPFTDFSLTAPGTTTEFTPDGKLKFEFPSTDNAAFFRIEAK